WIHAGGSKHRPGVDEPDELSEDADFQSVRGGEARSGAVRRIDSRERDRWPDSFIGTVLCGGVLSSTGTIWNRAGFGKQVERGLLLSDKGALGVRRELETNELN